jgi:hypothetical protein
MLFRTAPKKKEQSANMRLASDLGSRPALPMAIWYQRYYECFSPVILLVAILCLAISVLFSLAQAIMERDWPRETFKYVVIFGIILGVALSG